MDRRIERVVPLLEKEEKNKNDYIPKVVSIGPYHHGKPELASVEAFKPQAVDLFVSGGPDIYLRALVEIIGEIRQCYEETSTAKYSDDELAGLMLRDACFIITHMEMEVFAHPENDRKRDTMKNYPGLLTMLIVPRDLFLLENQIPLSVIKLLINLRYEAGPGKYYENLLNSFLNHSIFGEHRQKGVFYEIGRAEPLHLLEAFHGLLSITNPPCQPSTRRPLPCFDIESSIGSDLLRTLGCKKAAKKVIHSFRSVTDLKAKGIFFQPSPTRSLMDVGFKSHFFYATVQLPYWYVSIYTKVFFLNMIAYELSPNSSTGGEVTSYINFMKSLMERAEDVKELRDKKILYNTLGSDEEVLSVYKDIHTYGADNQEVFRHVKDKIEAHYQSTTKTWMAEFIHTYFRTPWTVIAFLAAISLLAISVAQLHYAIYPN